MLARVRPVYVVLRLICTLICGKMNTFYRYLVCERLADDDDGSYDDDNQSWRSGRGTFQVPEEFLRSSKGTYSRVTVNGGQDQNQGDEGSYNDLEEENEVRLYSMHNVNGP